MATKQNEEFLFLWCDDEGEYHMESNIPMTEEEFLESVSSSCDILTQVNFYKIPVKSLQAIKIEVKIVKA